MFVEELAMRFGLMCVEGVHDVEFVARLLHPLGFRRVQMLNQLDAALRCLVPKDFPPGGDMLRRVPVPLFLSNGTFTAIIQSAIGVTEVAKSLGRTFDLIPPTAFTGVGVILDADASANERFRTFVEEPRCMELPLSWPNRSGEVGRGNPSSGIFILPDNVNPGSLETVLIDCGNLVYPSILSGAATFVTTTEADDSLHPSDRIDFLKPSGKNKAIIGCVANVLRPGKAMQVSIQDNRWLDEHAMQLPRIRDILQFVMDLFELYSLYPGDTEGNT